MQLTSAALSVAKLAVTPSYAEMLWQVLRTSHKPSTDWQLLVGFLSSAPAEQSQHSDGMHRCPVNMSSCFMSLLADKCHLMPCVLIVAGAYEDQIAARHTMLAALIEQLVSDARSGCAVVRDWRCAQLNEAAIQIARKADTEADANLVAALVCGMNDESLLSESALQAVIQHAVQLLEPAWKAVSVSGAQLLFHKTWLASWYLVLHAGPP